MNKPRIASHGLSFFIFVLIFGIIFALIGITVGLGFTLKIPTTEINISFGGSIGRKEAVHQILPDYLNSRIADDKTFINSTNTATIWIAEELGFCVIGYQPEAPSADISLILKNNYII